MDTPRAGAVEDVRSERERVRGLMSDALKGHGEQMPPQLATIRAFEPLAIPRMIFVSQVRRPRPLIRVPDPPTVLARLKAKGWLVSVQHMRFIRNLEDVTQPPGHTFPASMYDWRSHYRDRIDPMKQLPAYGLLGKGGLTTVKIKSHVEGTPTHIGQALCHPDDNFCRRDGLIIALERALLDAGFRWDEV